MSSVLFDTHGFVKRLVGAGMPEQQAEILAEEHARLLNERLATKVDLEQQTALLQRDAAETKAELQRDLAETKAELQHEIAKLRVELQRDMAEMKADLQRQMGDTKAEILKWVAGMIVAQVAVTVTLLRLLL